MLARVLQRTGGSVLAVALWHTLFNVTTATAAGHGMYGAVASTAVMLWAGLLLLLEWRRPQPRLRLADPHHTNGTSRFTRAR